MAAFRRRLAWAVSIHAPRVGSDPNLRFDKSRHVLFQSTLPVWGATSSFAVMPKLPGSFNPRSPCGERLHPSRIMPLSICFNPRSPWGATARFGPDVNTAYVSIHAPRVGSDCKNAQNSFSNFRGICRLCQKASCGTKYKRQSSVHSVRILAKFMREATGNLLGVSPSHLQNG